jgi:GT2 family glycosyltransferase
VNNSNSLSYNGLVSVIIVNYNGEELLQPCLRSVQEQSYKNIEILFVDNASGDNSIAVVQQSFPSVKVITSKVNLGFSGGNNLGARHASGEYLVLLNNDTVVDKEWLTSLLNDIQNGTADIITSKVITDGVPDEYYAMNGSINYLGYNIMRVFTDRSKVFFAGGASVILKNDRSGMIFPEEYFLYHEDVYLSWMARLQGRSVAMCQESIVYHRGSATTKKQISAFSTYYQERNRLLNAILFYRAGTLLKLTPYFLADAIAKVLMSIVMRRKSFWGIVHAYGWILIKGRWILQQRKKIQSMRKVPDSEILQWMSCKVIDAGNGPAAFINRLSKYYSRITGLACYD